MNGEKVPAPEKNPDAAASDLQYSSYGHDVMGFPLVNGEKRGSKARSTPMYVRGSCKQTDYADFQVKSGRLNHKWQRMGTKSSIMWIRYAFSSEKVPFSFWAESACFGAHAANKTTAALLRSPTQATHTLGHGTGQKKASIDHGRPGSGGIECKQDPERG